MNFPHNFEPKNHLNVDSLKTDSNDNDTIATAVGGATAFVAVFQEMIDNYYNNARDGNDGDSDSVVAEQRKQHHGSNVRSHRCRFNYARAKKAIFEDYLVADSLYGSEFKSIFRISRA